MLHTNPNFGSLVTLDIQLSDDNHIPERELKLREQRIQRDFPEGKLSNLSKVLLWLEGVSPSRFENSQKFETYFSVILIIAGVISGCLASAAVFYYDGSNPINIIPALIIFVFIPFFMLYFNFLFFLPNWTLLKIPFFGALTVGLSKLNPAQFFLGKLSKALKINEAHWLSRVGRSAIRKWVLIAGAQIFSVCFFFGALLYFLLRITFSDLAFGWSSTLDITSDSIFTLVNFISAPWREILPEAIPSLQLIEQTRFYRLDDQSPIKAHPFFFGSWWVFLGSCIFFYGLLPRILLLYFALLIRDIKMADAHMNLPGVTQLLWRLDNMSPQLDSRSDLRAVGSSGSSSAISIADLRLPPQTAFVSWAFNLEAGQLKSLSATETWDESSVFSVATGEEIDEDRTIAQVKALSPKAVCLFVKAWEVPTEEILEFAMELEKTLSGSADVFLVPIDPSNSEVLSAGADRQQQIWARKLKSLASNKIVLRTLSSEDLD